MCFSFSACWVLWSLWSRGPLVSLSSGPGVPWSFGPLFHGFRVFGPAVFRLSATSFFGPLLSLLGPLVMMSRNRKWIFMGFTLVVSVFVVC